MNRAHIDFETRSALNLKEVGSWKYLRHSSTSILCVSVAMHGQKPTILTPKDLLDNNILREIIGDQSVIVGAHSAHFEYGVMKYILHERMGYPVAPPPKRLSCTLARAAMCALPLSLEKLGPALDLPMRKDMVGKAAMLKLSKPKDYDIFGEPIWEENPELLALMYAYCNLDVELEMAVDARLPELPPFERAVFELDLLINERGVKMDLKAAASAAAMADQIITALNKPLAGLTGGAVNAATEVLRIKKWMETQGLPPVDSLDKESIGAMLRDDDIPATVKEVLEVRQQVGKTSTSKYQAILNVADPEDGRARGNLQYFGAATGRFAGRGVQMHNFPKGYGAQKDGSTPEQDEAIALITAGDATAFVARYGKKSMDALSEALRGMIVADDGKTLLVADFASIEARVILWLAQDENALDKFRQGINLYVDMAKFIYKREDISKHGTPKEYSVGKALILGAGFGLGGPRFQSQCEQAGVKLSDDEALGAIRSYREKYRLVVSMWYAIERAAANAVRTPGTPHFCAGNRVVWVKNPKSDFLVCRLPSGRHLRYYKPYLKCVETPRGEKEEIRFLSVGKGGAMFPEKTYGGKLTENIVQAIARDLLVGGMLNSEAAGYPTILTVHDEGVAEVDDVDLMTGSKSHEEFMRLMCHLPPWAEGLPVSAEGFQSKRYRK